MQQKNRLCGFSSEVNSLLYIVLAVTCPINAEEMKCTMERDISSQHAPYVIRTMWNLC
jgi:hypothetical protein